MARCSDPLRSVDYQRIWNPTIWKQDFLKVWFQMVRFFKRSGYSYCYSHSPNHLKTGPYEIQTFLSEIQIVFDKMAAICWFQMVGLLDFGSHSKSRPFEAQPLFDHSKSRLVWISDPHCTSNFAQGNASFITLTKYCLPHLKYDETIFFKNHK